MQSHINGISYLNAQVRLSSPMSLSRKIGGRPLLLAGFGSLLLLMVLAGGYALGTLEQVSPEKTWRSAIPTLQRDRALDRVQTGIYQSAIIMRDYLLASDEKSAAAQIERFAQSREQTDQALAECAMLIEPAESDALRELKSELQVYWKLLAFISEIPAENRLLRGSGVFVRAGPPASVPS